MKITFSDLWTRFWMRQAGLHPLGRLATWLATWFVPPYTARFYLARLNRRGYIDPMAVVYHTKLYVGCNIFIDNRVILNQAPDGGALALGDRVHILRDSILATGAGGSIYIGADTYIQTRCQIMGYKAAIHIGNNVQMASNCALYSYNHGTALGELMRKQPLQSHGNIVIGDDVWLGHGVIVLSGVHIGVGAVIGAGAVVTCDIPAGAIAVGSPARVVRMRDAAKRDVFDVVIHISEHE